MIRGFGGLWWVYLLITVGIAYVLDYFQLSLGLATGISIGVTGACALWIHLILRNRRKK